MARVLITGCSSGIGRRAAELLHERGHEVVATARDVGALADIEVTRRLRIDVRDPESIALAFATCGPLDAVVCNAGVSLWAPLECAPEPDIEWLFDTNLLGMVRIIKAALPGFRERGRGRIVVVSSTAARRVTPFIGCYAASKAAIEAIVESVRYETAAFGIKATIVEPGAIVTSMAENRRVIPTDGTAYDDLMKSMKDRVGSLHTEALPVDDAGMQVVRAVELPDPPLRMPVGLSAETRINERLSLSDADYETLVLHDLLGVDRELPKERT